MDTIHGRACAVREKSGTNRTVRSFPSGFTTRDGAATCRQTTTRVAAAGSNPQFDNSDQSSGGTGQQERGAMQTPQRMDTEQPDRQAEEHAHPERGDRVHLSQRHGQGIGRLICDPDLSCRRGRLEMRIGIAPRSLRRKQPVGFALNQAEHREADEQTNETGDANVHVLAISRSSRSGVNSSPVLVEGSELEMRCKVFMGY